MLNTSFTLPCGTVIQNRLVKAAMTERISRTDYAPNELHNSLYTRWAKTQAGILLTGNVMITRTHLESAGNIVADRESILPKLQQWAAAGTSQGNHLWMQISHSGRQTSRFVNPRPLSASDVQLKKMGLFGKPRAMTEADIQEVIEGFIRTAKLAQTAGFTGVQVHSAHGYLLNQFLSPHTNRRTDKWGGSLENRARLLMTIVRGVRQTVGANYPISVKLNSADFQRGGFEEHESLVVIKMLADEGLDLLEISGGTYERIVFFGEEVKESTRKREAYFLDFAKKVREISTIPLMVTGGFRTHQFAKEALERGELDFIGIARPFLTAPEKIAGFIQGEVERLEDFPPLKASAQLRDSAEGGMYGKQLIRIAKGQMGVPNYSAIGSALYLVQHELGRALRKRFFGK